MPKFPFKPKLKLKSSKLYDDMMAPKKHELEKPKTAPLAYLALYVAVMVAFCVYCCLQGAWLLGICFLALGVLPAAAVTFLASSMLASTMARPAARAVADPLGSYLGEGGDELVRGLSRQVAPEGRQTIEANRQALAGEVRAWMEALPQGAAFEDVRTTSDDGTELCGHALECNPGSGRWLVYAHGLTGNYKDGLPFAPFAADKGYNLLFVDLRAHGGSGGEWVGAGWLDRRDLVAWCNWVVARAGQDARIVLMGQSMGAASVLCASGEKDLPQQVAGVVADCAYADFWNESVHVLTSSVMTGGKGMTAHPVLDLQRAMFKHRAGGYDIALARPVEAVTHAQAPVMLVHGEDDKSVPVWMSELIDEAARGAGVACEFVRVPDAGHCTSVFAAPDVYFEALGRAL